MNDEPLPGPDGYEISTDPVRLDAELIHRWLSLDAYWALGRSREKQDRAIASSLNFGAYRRNSGAQVGYARVVTDLATSDAHGVYAKLGFTALAEPGKWMALGEQ